MDKIKKGKNMSFVIIVDFKCLERDQPLGQKGLDVNV